ncbi:MAG: UDP-N-acetylglucosamine 1-carboxyvinyltransferase [bacterium]
MSKFVIQGPCSLHGEIDVSGSKNAALPIITATILAKGKFRISNVPMITDIQNMLLILKSLGSEYTFTNNTLLIDNTKMKDLEPDSKIVKNIRASILLIGPLLSRFGKVKIAQPGGCFIGSRPVKTHFDALKKLGSKIIENEDSYEIICNNIVGSEITLNEISVTATENILMAAVLATGNTKINLAACEPHIEDFCNFLVKMGANISGIGTHTLSVVGTKRLNAIDYTIIPDQIEAGTFAIAAAASRGDLTISGFIIEHHYILLKLFDEANVRYEILNNNTIRIKPIKSIFPINKIRTDIYPNFASDLQAPMGILMTQAEGTSSIFETMFEGRLNYLNELNKMGADCFIKNSHEATITGPTPLFGSVIESLDLRAGATLLIAAFIAEGESTIENAQIIDRGYENIDIRLNNIGASIQRINS